VREYPIKAVLLGAVMILAIEVLVVTGFLLFFTDKVEVKAVIHWKGQDTIQLEAKP